MKSIVRYSYITITILFVLCTIFEIFIYLNVYSNLLGIIYMFNNYFILFLFFTITLNYEKADKNIRISKNILAIIVGIFSSYFLGFLIPNIISYVDSSFIFNDRVYIISKILKPILYLMIAILSFVELKPNFINKIFNIILEKNKAFE